MSTPHVVIIGAGIGGQVAALLLAARGVAVTVVERAATPGGKMRRVAVGDGAVDAGPTVFTMRHVFEGILDAAGESLDRHLELTPLDVLARHAWNDGGQLDLYANRERSADAIGAFAGPTEARGYLDFCAQARRIHDTLNAAFMAAPRPNPLTLVNRTRRTAGLAGLRHIKPFGTLWTALGRHFRDPRLRQLFGRYATYCGSSPYLAPATLMLVAHVEQEGVWLVGGGMQGLARTFQDLAETRGARYRFGAGVAEVTVAHGRAAGVVLESGERLACDAVVCNADTAALAAGRLGAAVRRAAPAPLPARRSLSALTWTLRGTAGGFPLTHHNVFFSRDYAAEFQDIFARQHLPGEPTVYLCAQDRGPGAPSPAGPERLLCLVNAPPNGDTHSFNHAEVEACRERTFAVLARCGLGLEPEPGSMTVTTPSHFEALFPATGGALYGPASHGWQASFRRPGSRSRLPGLYLAGGSTHPGPGLPMAATSGRLAAEAVLGDLPSTARSRRVAMPGGTWMP